MGLVRILVDGYSLLHHWPELAPGKPRHSRAARNELIHWLTSYYDASGTPVTIVFDGTQAPPDMTQPVSTPEVEVLYSRAGRTADQVIERATHMLSVHGEVLVVTDDSAVRETASASGGAVASCQNFIRLVEDALETLAREIKSFNQQERLKFNTPH